MAVNLCDYGCGKEGIFYYKNANKWCCSDNWHKCPAKISNIKKHHVGKKRSEQTKKNISISLKNRGTPIKDKIDTEIKEYKSLIGIKPCAFCGRKSNFLFIDSKTYCCESHYLKCPGNKNKRKRITFGKKVDVNKLCSYGCGKKAEYKFKNGSFCCSIRLQSCPEIKKRNSETNKIKQSGENNAMYGRKQTDESKKKNSDSNKKVWKDPNSVFNSKKWRDKIRKSSLGRKLPQLLIFKRIRRNHKFFCKIENIRYNKITEKIEVRCKNHLCSNSKEKDGWFTPTSTQISERIRQVEHGNDGSYFYCSENCKQQCPLYNLRTYLSKDINPLYTQQEYQQFRKHVLERDNYKCQYCEEKAEHIHHERPQKLEPFYSLDPDLAWSVCSKCHYEKGHKDECSTGNLASKICK